MMPRTTRVLIVEDMAVIARLTQQMLQKALSTTYTSAHTTTLAATLATLSQQDFDIVLLDLNLPDSRELATVAKVVEQAPEVPVIVLTASNDDELGLKAVQLGAQDFLLKGDFNYIELDRAIMFAIERHRLQRTIRQLAVLDELTGLYNRRGFNTLHPDIFEQVARTKGRGFLCFFDLDRFKLINDELGHAAGDDALREFAGHLNDAFRRDALLVRFGGDEFVAMGAEHVAGQAEQAVHLLECALTERNGREDPRFPLETSWGLVHFDGVGPLDIGALSAAADEALYRHKEAGRRRRRQLGQLAMPGRAEP